MCGSDSEGHSTDSNTLAQATLGVGSVNFIPMRFQSVLRILGPLPFAFVLSSAF